VLVIDITKILNAEVTFELTQSFAITQFKYIT